MINPFVRKIIVALSYVAMIFVNYLANALPINDLSTGAVSDAYPNLFAPPGFTFAIWGVIYALLLCYVVYQFTIKEEDKAQKKPSFHERLAWLFVASCWVNATWIFAWHYRVVPVSLSLIVLLLFILINISELLYKRSFSIKERVVSYWPFMIYFGWITVATIANATVFFVSINWDGFGWPDHVWTAIILLVGAAIGATTFVSQRSMAYGWVLVWAYFGILYKHWSPQYFNYQYPLVISTLSFCLAIFIFAQAYVAYRSQKKRKK